MSTANNNKSNDSPVALGKVSTSKVIGYALALVILLIATGILIYYLLFRYDILPISSHLLVQEIITASLGVLVVYYLGKEIERASTRLLGQRRGNMIYVVYRFVAYTVLALALLAVGGASPTALLAGGTFAGLVLGLAAQTVLSNIIAGIMIILSRPYTVGDRITFISWQYGLLVPMYPPKLYSQDSLMPGYSGLILDIELAYTKMQLDDGPTVKIPNSVMVTAAVVSHEIKERWVRTKYDVPLAVDPNVAIRALTEGLKKNPWVVNPDSIRVLVNTTSPTIYVVSIDALCKGNMEETPRSALLIDIMQIVAKLTEEQKRKEGEEEKQKKDDGEEEEKEPSAP